MMLDGLECVGVFCVSPVRSVCVMLCLQRLDLIELVSLFLRTRTLAPFYGLPSSLPFVTSEP